MESARATRRGRRPWPLVLAVAVALATPAGAALGAPGDGTFTTVAGGLSGPRGIAAAGSSRLVVSIGANKLYSVSSSGSVSTAAGTGVAGFSGDGGPATLAQLNYPTDVITIGSGPYQGTLIADENNHRIRLVSPGGVISTVAGNGVAGFSGDGGPATAAELRNPRALAATPDGGFLIADEMNNRIRQVSPSGIITTVAGNGAAGAGGDGGSATSAQLRRPLGVASIGSGHFLIADGYNDCVREVQAGRITRFAGDCGDPGFAGDGGPATSALLSRPRDVVGTPDGGAYIADSLNNRIRRVSPDGVITTVGPDGNLNEPSNLFLESSGDLLVADTNNNLLRRLRHPLPTLTSLVPTSASADSGPLTLVVNGTGFADGATVLWQGSPRPTTRASSTSLTAAIPATDVDAQGSATVAVRTGASGGDVTGSVKFTVRPPSPNATPQAAFTVSASPTAGVPVTFTDASTDADGTIAARAWDLNGDGAFDDGTGATATTTFAAPGTYTVRLRVTDDKGASAIASGSVAVAAAPAPVAPAPPKPAPQPGVTGTPGKGRTTHGGRHPRVSLTAAQLLINQRISQAALVRANAALAALRTGLPTKAFRLGSLGAGAFSTGVRLSGAATSTAAGASQGYRVPIPKQTRTGGGRVTVSAAQLLVNQRISQAAVRRANAVRARLVAGLTAAQIARGAITPALLRPGLAFGTLGAPVAGTPIRVAGGRAGASTVPFTLAQLLINQRISQAAVRRANDDIARLERGLTDADIARGGIGAQNIAR